ncbi:MAG: glutamine--fructose-6-phosphate transaminase (isomerizing) [Clostridium sp.]|nr:glutamine--fructose-6-phosphate transaminase (isomerizing) [Clostridium sp.]
MCGIVGYIGNKQASDILIKGLEKLEYRGYDSSGVAILNNKIEIRKFKGRLINLTQSLNTDSIEGTIGIGHTRWATHGEPSDINAHPHSNNKLTISVVHNGIIENYLKLREWLISKGYKFYSQTDTEIIPNLIDYYYNDNLLDAVIKATSKLKGSFAIGVISSLEPDKLIAVKKDSPLIIGIGQNEYFIASDIPAILNHTKNIYLLNDNEFVTLKKDGIDIRNKNNEIIKKEIFHVTWSVDAAEKCGYEDFMLKEIHEQPKAVRYTLSGKISLNENISFDKIKFTKNDLANFDKIYIIACGTAYHAGIVGKYAIEKLANISVETDIASEFRYRNPIITNKTLVIVVSQSGETADTLAVLRDSKKHGARVLAITNVVGSSVAREADDVFYTLAGPEIAVASTKAYITQLVAFYILALHFAELKGLLSSSEIKSIKQELINIPDKIDELLKNSDDIKKYASYHFNKKDLFFLGRGLDFAVALEGSLKLKEISYIHSEAYAGGELKHGPIALIEKGTSVITLLTQEALQDKMISNIKEVTTRGGNILAIVNDGCEYAKSITNDIIYIPKTIDLLTPLLSVIPLQLLSYYIAKLKGCDVDKPRNLAKSVTVE